MGQVEGKVWLAGNTNGQEHRKNKDVQWDCFTDLMRMGTAGKGPVASMEKDQTMEKDQHMVSQ